MYTDEQYARAKAQVGNAPPEAKAILRQRIREYEQLNPQHASEPTGVAKLDTLELGPSDKPNVPELPPAASGEAPHGVATELNSRYDASLPNASKLKELSAPPEYVSKNPTAGLSHIWGAFAGNRSAQLGAALMPAVAAPAMIAAAREASTANSYFEPSREKFIADMGPVLAARGIPTQASPIGTRDPRFEEAYNEYADRKWQQAYEKAAAEDRPLTRLAYVQHSGSWDRLKDYLATGADQASAFAKGYLNGVLPGANGVLDAAGDVVTGSNDAERNREQASRDKLAMGAGEFIGAANPDSLANKAAGAVGKLGTPRSLLGRLGVSALGGAVAADAQLAGNAVGQAAGDLAHGGSVDSARDSFTSNLLNASLMGGGMGALGGLLGEGASAYRRHLRRTQLGGELGNLEAGGGATDVLSGIDAPAEVKANLEAARPAVPGENKASAEGNPVEIQARKVQGPIASQNVSDQAGFRARAAAENTAELERDPSLQQPKPASTTANAVIDLVKARTQPEAREGAFIPNASSALPGRDNSRFVALAKKLWRPRLVLGVDALREAQSSGGRVVSLDEAGQLGYDLDALRAGIAKERPVSESIPGLLPRYSREELASAGAPAQATPEEAAALRRFTFGKRDPSDAAVIDQFLEKAPVSPLPHVYRGLVLSPEQASELLDNDTFSIGDTPKSVSADPMVARSFVARNQTGDGDVGITLKLEHSSARDIQPYAHSQVGVEKELLIPSRTRFEIVSKHPDPANPGNWIVVARETGREGGRVASSIEDVFGRPADKIEPSSVDRLKPREGRANSPPQGQVGSEWFDQAGAAETVGRHADGYGSDSFAGQRTPAPERSPSADTPTRLEQNTRPDNGVVQPDTPSIRPSGPPTELTPPRAGKPATPGIPNSEYKVILEPREYNAKDFEQIVDAFDDAAKADRKGAHVDPAWKQFQAAVRKDREQFGQRWVDLKAAHHAESTALEQRAGHAGLGDTPQQYEEMPANSQKAFNSALANYGSRGSTAQSNQALKQLAERAGVLHELETLRSQRAYDALSEKASPALHETVGPSGAFARVGGFGPAVKLRLDAAARAVERGPTGSRVDINSLSPALLDLVRRGTPITREVKPVGPLLNLFSMNRGALGAKAGAVYSSTRNRGQQQSLTPEQVKFLETLIDSTR